MEEITLIRSDKDGLLSFGNYMLKSKQKFENFECGGDIYKVKTFSEITKLEKNGMLVYESVPGTEVTDFKATADGVDFMVEGAEDAQITVELAEDTEYRVYIDDMAIGKMATNLAGKLSINVELEAGETAHVVIRK